MRYIRTKNGIYEVVKNELGECIKIDGGFVMLEDVRLIEESIREADTIEELCDKFVDQEYHYIIQNKEIIKEIPNNPTLKNHTIYGAIWTSKGLIYVAKMNKDGKLVLI